MPKVIYAFGDANLLNTVCFSIVGTRHITDYGKLECKYFARELTKLGLTIVSGMAIGTDSIAHDECINNGGKTIAVLGCGFNKIDEKSKKIYNKILNSGGLVISEYEIDEEAKPNNFPHRNRIICGLSEGILAIEATQKSGTGTSMRWAKRLNIPTVGIVDTNCNPEDLDYPIPGNDDAIRAVKLIADVMANAVIEGKQGESFEPAEEQDITEDAETMEQVVAESEENVEE